MKDWNEMSKEDKKDAKGSLILLAMILFFVFLWLYGDYETEYIEEHGVWTILTVKDSYGRQVYYTFRLNNQIYRGKTVMTIKEIEEIEDAGNRLFMAVIPNEANRRRIYDAVPKWFKLDAPPEGWKRRPTTRELEDMLWKNDKNRTSENDVSDDGVSQNQTHEAEIAIKEDDEYARKDRARLNKVIVINSILLTVFSVILIFLRRKKIRYIEEHGVWTILTITEKEKSESMLHYKISYVIQLNNRMFTGSTTLSKKKVKSSNRFFIKVVPNEEKKWKEYDAVPEWFTLDAPSKGWEKHPTESELREMIKQK